MKREAQRSLLRESLDTLPPPFTGEQMMCIVCGIVETSESNVSKGWRCIELDRQARYYICPREMPTEPASTNQWSDAYVRAFHHIVQKTPGYKPANSILIWIERGGQVTSARFN
jgi:hypothetical protein